MYKHEERVNLTPLSKAFALFLFANWKDIHSPNDRHH